MTHRDDGCTCIPNCYRTWQRLNSPAINPGNRARDCMSTVLLAFSSSFRFTDYTSTDADRTSDRAVCVIGEVNNNSELIRRGLPVQDNGDGRSGFFSDSVHQEPLSVRRDIVLLHEK